MCVTNVYVDRYPDGKETVFRQTVICRSGRPGQPCQKLSIIENPVRKIQFGEPTSEYIMTATHTHHQYQQRIPLPQTPPRSSGGSPYRRSGEYSSEDAGLPQRRRSSQLRSEREQPALTSTRIHRKERIVIVDSPPTSRTPPQTFRTFTAPSSPASPVFIIDSVLSRSREREHERVRGRPVIVDERPMRRQQRVPSIGAVVGERPVSRPRARSPSRNRNPGRDSGVFLWESPSTSHTSFDSRARREAEEVERRVAAERDQRLAAERRKAQRIKEQDEEIRRRPAVPLPPQPLRGILKPVTVDQSLAMMGDLKLRDFDRVVVSESEMRRRMEERERVARRVLLEREEEDMKRRLRERQMPKRRSSVGPGTRRHRVLYDDGVYRWE